MSEVGGRVKDLHLRLIERLDREQTPSYDLTVVAVDGGRPARSAQLAVHVVVVDANDNAPSFDHAEYLVEVREDVASGGVPLQCRIWNLGKGFSYMPQFLADGNTRVKLEFIVEIVILPSKS